MVICKFIRYEFFLKRLNDFFIDKIFFENFKNEDKIYLNLTKEEKIKDLLKFFFEEIEKKNEIIKKREFYYEKIKNYNNPLEISKNDNLKKLFFENLNYEISIFKNNKELIKNIFQQNISKLFLIPVFWDLYLNFLFLNQRDYFFSFFQENKIFLTNLEYF